MAIGNSMVLIRDLPAKESDYVKVEDCGLGHDHTDGRKAEESVVQHLKVKKHCFNAKNSNNTIKIMETSSS